MTDHSIDQLKRKLRRDLLDRLRSLDDRSRAARSAAACAHLAAHEVFQKSTTVMLFLSMPDEIDTAHLLEATRSLGKRVIVPRVVADQPLLELCPLDDPSAVRSGTLGIREPTDPETVGVDTLDLIVVPGLAFDRCGGRLGRGGGFYDRLLADPRCTASLCGIGFDFQLLSTPIPTAPHDRPVGAVVTDTNGWLVASRS